MKGTKMRTFDTIQLNRTKTIFPVISQAKEAVGLLVRQKLIRNRFLFGIHFRRRKFFIMNPTEYSLPGSYNQKKKTRHIYPNIFI